MRLDVEPAKRGPEIRACKVCWAAPDDETGRLTCGHRKGTHKWRAERGLFCAWHPGYGRPLVGEFAYPLTAEDVERYRARTINVVEQELQLEPRGITEWWIEPDPTVPEALLEALAPPPETSEPEHQAS